MLHQAGQQKVYEDTHKTSLAPGNGMNPKEVKNQLLNIRFWAA
jgi:hypothetical protein